MHTLGVLIIGALIGALAGLVVGRNESMGCIANVLAGLAGSFVGERLFGHWGWQVAGISIFPAILGAILVVIVVTFIMNRFD